MNRSNPDVYTYIVESEKWENELKKLREILLGTELNEEFKWRAPCYTYNNKNILMLAHFKDSCRVSFFKGVLLKDEKNLLFKPGKNSQSSKYLQFENLQEIESLQKLIPLYVKEAINIERQGKKVPMKAKSELEIPKELQDQFDEDPSFSDAFYSLTPGRQRGYVLHFSGAKQASTRVSRIEKYKNRIFDGKGFHDCVCGLSERMPRCDGSHKQLEQ